MWSVGRLLVLVMCAWGVDAALGFAQAQTVATTSYMGHQFELPIKGTPTATPTGKALPPLGYVDFCARAEAECKFAAGKVETLEIDTEAWNKIAAVNHEVNQAITPVSDFENYGVADYWTYPVTTGDCEDYVLLKKRYLSELGINSDELLITVVLDENHEGHAVLTIPTDKGDYVLDNRRMEILRWDQTGYAFLKRQSQPQSNQWVSLQRGAPQVPVATRAR